LEIKNNKKKSLLINLDNLYQVKEIVFVEVVCLVKLCYMVLKSKIKQINTLYGIKIKNKTNKIYISHQFFLKKNNKYFIWD